MPLLVAGRKQTITLEDQWLIQKETVLAWLRAGFALVALVVIQFNPSRTARYPVLAHVFLIAFLLYSLIVLYLARRERTDPKKLGLITTCLDLIWVSSIVFTTGAVQTPFFAYYFFPVITASSRYGIKGGLSAALVGVVLYGFIRLYFVWDNPISIDLFIVRSVYLVFLAYIFGLLSEFERKQNQKLLALSKTAGEVAMRDERRRIARELHDGLLQSLATHLLRLETCRKRLLVSPTELDRELQSIEDETRSSMKLIRQFLAGKETQSFPPGMLLEYLRGDLRFLRDGLGMEVILETEPEDLDLPDDIERDLYFVLREGLMNITRHSQASRADIVLRQTATDIRGTLTDDGVGFHVTDVSNGQGLGLTSMRERIKKLRGELEIQSSPGKGARLSFVLPLEARRAVA
ncbi:MAG TPA: sensor histidine kinase [Candidatus Binatia bacterium]|nr:sensor histidine kinase [Candidatus Binatia bacterium]